jgi:uncharacterized delta-60 repeat protein
VAAGLAERPNEPPIDDRGTLVPATDFAVARYMQNGTLDPSFDGDGKVTTDFDLGADEARGVAVQADGRIVAAGVTVFGSARRSDVALARYTADGALDATFANGGTIVTDFDEGYDSANAVGLQANGKIVVAGNAMDRSGQDGFALARYTPEGTLDTGFGEGGKVMTQIGVGGQAFALALEDDGQIVAAGHASSQATGLDFALARYVGDKRG